jgi:hypothetical protein
MAEITLDRRWAERGALPAICIACDSTTVRLCNMHFHWIPKETRQLRNAMAIAGVIAGMAIAAVMFGALTIIFGKPSTDRVFLRLPTCDRHRPRPAWLPLTALVSAALFLFVFLGLVVIMKENPQHSLVQPRLEIPTILVTLVVCLLMVIFAFYMGAYPVTLKEATAWSIRLSRVSEAFVQGMSELEGTPPELSDGSQHSSNLDDGFNYPKYTEQ